MARKALSIIGILVLVCGLAVGNVWAAKLKIGMVFDVGGKGDQSFNDSAYRGLQWASKFDISHVEIEPGAARMPAVSSDSETERKPLLRTRKSISVRTSAVRPYRRRKRQS